jgi:hypothetical protein
MHVLLSCAYVSFTAAMRLRQSYIFRCRLGKQRPTLAIRSQLQLANSRLVGMM